MTLDRTRPPATRPFKTFEIAPPIIEGDEVPIQWIPDDHSEIAYLELTFESGRWWEEVKGVSHFASKLLTGGTTRLSSKQINEQFESWGSQVQIANGPDFITIRLFTLKKYFDQCLALLAEVITEASFPEDEFQLLQELRVHELKSQWAKNNQLATMYFNEHLFGQDHPYGWLLHPSSVSNVTLDDVRNYYSEKLFHAPKAVLVGNLQDKIPLVKSLLGNLTTTTGTGTHHEASTKPSILKKAVAESTQASIRLGAPMVTRTHPDIHELAVANVILGGYFGSRLMKNIREEKGLTYGISSQLVHLKNASYFLISSEVEVQNGGLVISEIQKEIADLAAQPPSTEELETAINYARGQILNATGSSLSLASLLKKEFIYEEPAGYYNEFLTKLDTITPERISLMADRYFQTDYEVLLG